MVHGDRDEQEPGTNPFALILPASAGKHWRSSNFNRRVLAPAHQAAGRRDADGEGTWTWHSLQHVLCTAALFTWELDPTDVSRMASHANYRITPRHVRWAHRRHPGSCASSHPNNYVGG
jgi:hypothetical protein